MRERTKFLPVVAAMLLLPAAAPAAVTNGGFETGTTAGWTLTGQGFASTASMGITPTAGTFQGDLETTGNFTALAPAIVAAMGIPPSAIAALAVGAPVNGTCITQSVTVSAGDVLSFDWNFISDELNESATYNDFAFYTINSAAFLLASRNSSTFSLVSPPPGFDGQTGWATQNFTFPSSGTYTIGFSALNVGDAGHNSALLLDGVAISLPEPATITLAPLAIAAIMRRRSRRAVCDQ